MKTMSNSNVELELSHYDDFASEAFAKFMELWKNGREAALNINCKDRKLGCNYHVFLVIKGMRNRSLQAQGVRREPSHPQVSSVETRKG